MNFFNLLPFEICLLIPSYLRYTDVEVISTFNSVFDQIFNEKFKTYKQFYDLTTWYRKEWDKILNCIFDDLLDDLKEILATQKKLGC